MTVPIRFFVANVVIERGSLLLLHSSLTHLQMLVAFSLPHIKEHIQKQIARIKHRIHLYKIINIS